MPDLSAKDRRDARKWLIKMMDRPDLHQAGLEAWLAGRPDRREFYLSLHRRMDRAAAGAELAGMQPGQSVVRPDRSPASRSRAWGRVAATGLAFVAVLGVGLHTFSRHLIDLPGVPAHVRLSTRVGEVRPERLDDGTIVTLDTGTAIDVKIAQGMRTVVLRHGRARFAVASTGTDMPLTVQDGGNSVVANAGIFDVSDRGNLSTLVVEGSAEVRLRPAVLFLDSSRSVRLDAGQKLILASGQGATPSAVAARPSDAQWIGGVKSFSEVPIDEVIAEANTYSETKIVLADPSLGARLITAELHIRDVEAVAKAVAGFLKLSIVRTQPGRLILTAGNQFTRAGLKFRVRRHARQGLVCFERPLWCERHSGMRANSFAIFFAPAVILSSWATGAMAQEPSRLHYEMPSMNLSVALRTIARRTDHQLVADSIAIRGKRSKALRGDFTVDEAIALIITGLGLDFEIKDRTIFIRPAAIQPTTVQTRIRSTRRGGLLARFHGFDETNALDRVVVRQGDHVDRGQDLVTMDLRVIHVIAEKLPRQVQSVLEKEHRDQQERRRKSEHMRAPDVLVYTRFGAAGFNFAKPPHANTHLCGETTLRLALRPAANLDSAAGNPLHLG